MSKEMVDRHKQAKSTILSLTVSSSSSLQLHTYYVDNYNLT